MEFIETLTVAHLICLAGVALLACWLLRTSLGRRALADSAPRRNNLPPYTPFIPLFFWFGPMPLAILIAGKLAGDLQNWQGYFLDRLIYCIGAMVTVALIIFLARASFARRLKGFGLNAKTVHKDLLAAFVNLLAVWPLVMAAITLTVFFGELIWGGEYQLQQHQELELITEYSKLPLRVLIVIAAVVAAPVVEEMLFRGLFQTILRSYLDAGCLILDARRGSRIEDRGSRKTWLAIAISSALFAAVHAIPGHWPALFILGVCMGYSYEKSGSLLRPIFIHALFNAVGIIATLNQ